MGPSGAGKTTIGQALADALAWTFIEADALHPAGNIEKMRQGEPLTDADRGPWLDAIRRAVLEVTARGGSAVVACSALKQRYRGFFREHLPDVHFVHLDADRDVLAERVLARRGHFAGPALIDSQLRTLERPRGEALIVDAADTPAHIVARIRRALEL